MALSDQEAQRQIHQMVNFILNEAKEKAQEIEAKTLQDFNIEKLKIVQSMKEKVRNEYVKKMQKIEMDRAIERSTIINKFRLKKIKARDQILSDVENRCVTNLEKIHADSEKYKKICLSLIIQGLIRLMEDEVIIKCREMDKSIILGLFPEAQKKFSSIIQDELGIKKTIKIVLDTSFLPPPPSSDNLGSSCSGGIVLMPMNRLISCDNTFDERLKTVLHNYKPQIRKLLFN